MKSICLNMIVKNESRIIRRALESVKHLIDYWVICDTGSSDNTPEIINEYFAAEKIPGELHHVEWINFGHNRTQAAALAREKADYLLFLDADMQLVDQGFDKNTLTQQHYMINIHTGNLSYYITRLVSTDLEWQSVGVTHEYFHPGRDDIPAHRLHTLYFIDHVDGGCRDDKFTRDIDLLSQGLVNEPDNARYQFYLADSYRNIGNYQAAIGWYDRRIASGGWEEEVYYSKYMKMVCQIKLALRFEEWLYTGLDAFSYRPSRLEALCEIIRHCRETGQYRLGYQLGRSQEQLPYPGDVLFVDREIHTWKFLDELSVCAYWAGDVGLSKELIERLLSEKKFPETERMRLLDNLSYSHRKV